MFCKLFHQFRYSYLATTLFCVRRSNKQTDYKPPEYVSFSHIACTPLSNGTIRIEDMQKRKLQYKYVVCIHGSLRNFNNHHRFVEHVEVNRMFGADHYVLYNNTGSQALRDYIDFYIDQGFMELHDWHFPKSIHGHHYFGQISLITDCMYRFMYRTQFLALIDLDEFIVPRKHNSWEAMLNTSSCNNHSAVLFRNVFFNLANPDDKAYNLNMSSNQSQGFVTLRKSVRDIKPFNCRVRSKIMIQPHDVSMPNIHYGSPRVGGKSCCMNITLGLLHHYRAYKIQKNENVSRDPFMFRFASKIIQSVQTVLRLVEKTKALNSTKKG